MKETRVNLTVIVLILVCIGIVMIYSASCVNALENFHDSVYYLKRHILFLGMGLIACLAAMSMDYRQIQPHARKILGVSLFLLVLVLIPHIGTESYGARRWFKLGVF